MHYRLPLTLSALVLIGSLGCSPAAPAESPKPPAESEAAPPEPAAEPEAQEEKYVTPDPSKNPAKQPPMPDDYSMTTGDCNELARQYANAVRADQKKMLDPKLKGDKLAQVEQNINDVAQRMRVQWGQNCADTLVGQIVDPKALKCAMDAPSVKEFDDCLNSNPAPNK